MNALMCRSALRRLVVSAACLAGFLALIAPAYAYTPMRRGPQTAVEWAILLFVMVPVGILAYRAENARVEKRRRRLLEKGFTEDEIASIEIQRDLRLRLLALGLIFFGSPLLYWLLFA